MTLQDKLINLGVKLIESKKLSLDDIISSDRLYCEASFIKEFDIYTTEVLARVYFDNENDIHNEIEDIIIN